MNVVVVVVRGICVTKKGRLGRWLSYRYTGCRCPMVGFFAVFFTAVLFHSSAVFHENKEREAKREGKTLTHGHTQTRGQHL